VYGNAQDQLPIDGFTAPEFQGVRRAFEQNFRQRDEQGAACAIYHRGKKVVDLWGGYCRAETRKPWTRRTLVLTFSVSKGMAAAALAVAHSRHLFDLDEPVSAYWPEFGSSGKQGITVRQLLTHQAGLVSINTPLDARSLGNHDLLASILAEQRPAWRPGSRHGYHTLTLGWYQNELIRRVDPHHRSIGTFFQEEVARPLDIEFFIGLPPNIGEEQLASIKGFHRLAVLGHITELPVGMVLAGIWPRSLVARSIGNPAFGNPAEIGGPEYRRVEIPSGNGIGQARAIAKTYSVLAGDARELGICARTKRELTAPAATPELGTRDAILKMDTRYGFGFSRPSSGMRFGSDCSAFGAPGAGGSFGMADPNEQLGYAYLTNKMGFRIFDDPREKAVRDACYACLAAMRQSERVA
jgi:CubicO group peptidase (beta-lactamase class C family)